MQTGSLFLVSAPSGAGKTSLVNAALEADSQLAVSVSHTTRPARGGEVDGENYFFVNDDQFVQMIDEGKFLEHANVFGKRYGTSKAEVAAKRATETEAVEVDEGESLDEIKAKLKPKKKGGISADMLDTANTYDDKVALVRIIVTDEAGRVANVFKQMMREDLEVLK